MLRISYSDHYLSVVRSSVRACVYPFDRKSVCPLKFSNDFSEAEVNFDQISYGASLGRGNETVERFLNDRGLLTKVAAMPIYGKNL